MAHGGFCMISRKNLLYSIVLVVFLGAPFAHGMQRINRLKSGAKKFFTAQKMANRFKKTMQITAAGLFWGSTLWQANPTRFSYMPYIFDAEPESKKFVKAVLKEHGYPDSMIENIQVRQGNKFCATQTMRETKNNYIVVPFYDKDLKYAYQLSVGKVSFKGKISSNEYDHEYLAYRKKIEQKILDLKCAYPLISVPALRKYQEFFGKELSSSTLPLWKGSIVHEASHLVHDEPSYGHHINLLCAAFASQAGMGYTGKLMSKIPLVVKTAKKIGQFKLHIAQGIVAALLLPLKFKLRDIATFPYKKFCEYRADQEVIKRSSDPRVLEANASGYKAIDEVVLALEKRDNPRLGFLLKRFPQLVELLDPHPRPSVRSTYFAKAAENCQKDAAKCKTMD